MAKKATKKKEPRPKGEMVIYQAKSGAVELRGDISHETVWATQAQIAQAFDVDVRTINEHIGNIYKTKELFEKATLRKFRIVQKEGIREIARETKHYNLDMILSVGYRVNSKKATLFRQWATKTLRGYIVDGYAIDRKRVARNYERFADAVASVKRLLPKSTNVGDGEIVELIALFADTWLSLDAYDKDALSGIGKTKKQVAITAAKLSSAIGELKRALMEKGEATDLFGREREVGALAGIVGNVMQSFGGKPVYPSIEAQAAHLLYFIVKNHPFTDGNKRSGAFAFVWFLRHAKILDTSRLTPPALTALTILVAESDPKEMDRVVKLVLDLIKK